MDEYISVLQRTRLFAGVGEQELRSMFGCLEGRCCRYQKGERVLRQGEHPDYIIVLVEGRLHIQKDDYWGNRSIVSVIEVGEMFAEAYAAPDSGAVLNDVVAAEDSAVICFNVRKILTVCSSACRFHAAVVQNLFFAVAEKNRKLMGKLEHMSQRTTREKLISYLTEESRRQNSSSFSILLNRQQLADFLSVDRSAMSNELCKMRDEGMLTFEKNRFSLLYRREA